MEKEIFVGRMQVLVIRKNIKNMYLRVCPPEGDVRVTAPFRYTDAQIAAFVQAKADWIRKQQEQIRRRPARTEHRYETGELFYVWGAPCRLLVAEKGENAFPAGTRADGAMAPGLDEVGFAGDFTGNRRLGAAETETPQWIRPDEGIHTKWGCVCLYGAALYMEVMPHTSVEDRKKLLTEWYRRQMQQAVPEVLARCEARMGLHANEWRIRDMKTRWGTCNIRERRIWLSLHLAKYPPQCLEGVITHELVHLLERGHNKRFYHFMDRFCPDWRTVKKMLAERKD